MIVDVHVHAAPPEFLAALERIGAELVTPADGRGVQVRSKTLQLALAAEFLAPDALVRKLDSLGVDVALISIATLLVDYRLTADEAATVTQAANLGLARFAAAAPGRLRWLAHVPMQDIALAVTALDEAMAAGALGAQIGTHVNGRNLDDPSLKPFFAKAAELNAFLLVHAVDCLAAERMERHYASNLVGNPFESGLAVASTIFGRVHEQRSPLTMCFCHGGGAAPALAGRWDRAWSIDRLAGTKLPRAPSEYFRSLWFDSLTYGEEQLRLLAALAGPDRILLGSDQPFPIAHPDPVGGVRAIGWLSESEKAAILGGNAQRLLSL